MSYCPHCDKNVETEQREKLGKAVAKGMVKGAGATVNLAMKVSDQSHYETEKDQMFKHEARHNRNVRNRQSDAATAVMNSMNNKSLDLAMGSDHYHACLECNLEVDYPQCETRPEYLGASYDSSTKSTQKIVAGILFFSTYSILKSTIGNSSWIFFAAPVATAILGYFSINFIPLKPRGIVNLLGENIKSVIGVFLAASLAIIVGGLILQSIVDQGVVQNILFISYMAVIAAGSFYSLFLMNKQKWSEIKETWALLEQVEVKEEPEINHDKVA